MKVSTQHGDMIHGDCRELIKELPDESIDLAIVDPPYLVIDADWDKVEVYDENFVLELKRVLKPKASMYLWCGFGENSQSLTRWEPFTKKHLTFKDMIVLEKQRGNGNRKGWLFTREESMWFVKDNNSFQWNVEHQYSSQIRQSIHKTTAKSSYKRWTNVWTDVIEESFAVGKKSGAEFHDTPKPVKALKRIILAHTDPGDLVLAPFGGSGNDAIACIDTGRRFCLFELHDKIFPMMSKRVSDYASQGLLF